MNKYNIDDELFYDSMDVFDQTFRPILVRVTGIEKIENGQIIYTVKYIKAVGWNIPNVTMADRYLRSKKEINERSLYRDLEALRTIYNKSTHR